MKRRAEATSLGSPAEGRPCVDRVGCNEWAKVEGMAMAEPSRPYAMLSFDQHISCSTCVASPLLHVGQEKGPKNSRVVLVRNVLWWVTVDVAS